MRKSEEKEAIVKKIMAVAEEGEVFTRTSCTSRHRAEHYTADWDECLGQLADAGKLIRVGERYQKKEVTIFKVGDRVKVTKVEEALHSAGRSFWNVGDVALVIEPNECSGGSIVYIGQKGDSWKEGKAAFGTKGLELVKFQAGDRVRVINPLQAAYDEGKNYWGVGEETSILRLNETSGGNLVYVGERGDDWTRDRACFNVEGLELIKEEKKMGWGAKAVIKEEGKMTEQVAIEEAIVLWTRIVELGGLEGNRDSLEQEKERLCESLLGERRNSCPLCQYSKDIMWDNCDSCPYQKEYGKCFHPSSPYLRWGSAREGQERLKYALEFLGQLHGLKCKCSSKDTPKVSKRPEPVFKVGDRVKAPYEEAPFIITRMLWAEVNGQFDWGPSHKHWHYAYEKAGGILDAYWYDEDHLELAPQKKEWEDVTMSYIPEIRSLTNSYYLRLKSPDGDKNKDVSLWQGSMHYEGGKNADLKVELNTTPFWSKDAAQVTRHESFSFKILKRNSKS